MDNPVDNLWITPPMTLTEKPKKNLKKKIKNKKQRKTRGKII